MIATLQFPERWNSFKGKDSDVITPWDGVDAESKPLTLAQAKQLATELFVNGITYHAPYEQNIWCLVEFATANSWLLWLQSDEHGCVEVQLCRSTGRH